MGGVSHEGAHLLRVVGGVCRAVSHLVIEDLLVHLIQIRQGSQVTRLERQLERNCYLPVQNGALIEAFTNFRNTYIQ